MKESENKTMAGFFRRKPPDERNMKVNGPSVKQSLSQITNGPVYSSQKQMRSTDKETFSE